MMLDGITRSQGLPFSATFTDLKRVQGAYRFVESDRLSFTTVADALADATASFLRAAPHATMLCVQDTTEILIRRPGAIGFGPVGNPKCRGEFLHSAILVSTDGVPDGFLAAHTWVRSSSARGKAKKRKHLPFEDKESYRWWKTKEDAEIRLGMPGVLLHVADREGDILSVIQRAVQANYRILQRMTQNRRVEGPLKKLWPTCLSWSLADTRRIHIPVRRDDETGKLLPARDADLELRFGTVALKGRLKSDPSMTFDAIFVTEPNPPSGIKPVEWLLLTNDPITDVESAWKYVDYYRFRWVIEEYHKGLKTGCHVEQRQYADRAHLDVALPIYMVAALRILRLTKLARVDPDVPASTEFSQIESLVLCDGDAKQASKLTLREAVAKIARLGGHMGRRGDGPPGWITLWRGYSNLTERIEGFRLNLRL